MNADLPVTTKEHMSRTPSKGETTSSLLAAVSKQLETFEESDDEEIPSHMMKAQILPPKNKLRRQRSLSTDYDEKYALGKPARLSLSLLTHFLVSPTPTTRRMLSHR